MKDCWIDRETGRIHCKNENKNYHYAIYSEGSNHYKYTITTITGTEFPMERSFATIHTFYEGLYSLFKKDYYCEIKESEILKKIEKEDLDWFIENFILYKYNHDTYKLSNLGREGMDEAKKFINKINKYKKEIKI